MQDPDLQDPDPDLEVVSEKKGNMDEMHIDQVSSASGIPDDPGITSALPEGVTPSSLVASVLASLSTTHQ